MIQKIVVILFGALTMALFYVIYLKFVKKLKYNFFTLFLIYVILIVGLKVSQNRFFRSSAVNISTFEEAKNVVPGVWISTQLLYSDHKEYIALVFNKNGTVKLAQGSSQEQALRFANESLSGQWNVIQNDEYLSKLKSMKRFLIKISLPGIGDDILRVELHPDKNQMGRIRNFDDDVMENSGLFAFGGKIFYYQY